MKELFARAFRSLDPSMDYNMADAGYSNRVGEAQQESTALPRSTQHRSGEDCKQGNGSLLGTGKSGSRHSR